MNETNESTDNTYETGIQANRQFFNKLAPAWEDDAEFAPVRDEITVRAAIPAGSVILDAGCGKGVMVPHLLKTGPRKLYELDLSDEMMRLNRERWNQEPGDYLSFSAAVRLSHSCGTKKTPPCQITARQGLCL